LRGVHKALGAILVSRNKQKVAQFKGADNMLICCPVPRAAAYSPFRNLPEHSWAGMVVPNGGAVMGFKVIKAPRAPSPGRQ
jgi:hypothetical protein